MRSTDVYGEFGATDDLAAQHAAAQATAAEFHGGDVGDRTEAVVEEAKSPEVIPVEKVSCFEISSSRTLNRFTKKQMIAPEWI